MSAVWFAPDDRAVQLRRLHDEYEALGSERQQTAASIYDDVRSDELRYPVEVGGAKYEPKMINSMDTLQRTRLADALLAEYGLLDDYHRYLDLRRNWLLEEDHRPYLRFVTWQQAVRNFPSGTDGYWAELVEINDAAHRFHASVEPTAIFNNNRRRTLLLTSLTAYMIASGIQPSIFDRPAASWEVFADPLGILDTSEQ